MGGAGVAVDGLGDGLHLLGVDAQGDERALVAEAARIEEGADAAQVALLFEDLQAVDDGFFRCAELFCQGCERAAADGQAALQQVQ